MAIVRLPSASWSAKSSKANIESLKWKAQSYEAQKQVIINETSGEVSGLSHPLTAKKNNCSYLN